MIKILILIIFSLPMAANAVDTVNYKVREVAVQEETPVVEAKKTYVDIYIKDDAVVSNLEIIDPKKIDVEVLNWIKAYNAGRTKPISEDPKAEIGAVAP